MSTLCEAKIKLRKFLLLYRCWKFFPADIKVVGSDIDQIIHILAQDKYAFKCFLQMINLYYSTETPNRIACTYMKEYFEERFRFKPSKMTIAAVFDLLKCNLSNSYAKLVINEVQQRIESVKAILIEDLDLIQKASDDIFLFWDIG